MILRSLYKVWNDFGTIRLVELPVKKITAKMVIFEKSSAVTGYVTRIEKHQVGKYFFETRKEAVEGFVGQQRKTIDAANWNIHSALESIEKAEALA